MLAITHIFMQCHLVGVEQVLIGWRSKDGKFEQADHFETVELHQAAVDWHKNKALRNARPVPCWEPSVSSSFIDHVLREVRNACKDHTGMTIRFTYEPQKDWKGIYTGSGRFVGRLVESSDLATRVLGALDFD